MLHDTIMFAKQIKKNAHWTYRDFGFPVFIIHKLKNCNNNKKVLACEPQQMSLQVTCTDSENQLPTDLISSSGRRRGPQEFVRTPGGGNLVIMEMFRVTTVNNNKPTLKLYSPRG